MPGDEMPKVVASLKELYKLTVCDGELFYVSDEEEYYMFDENSGEWMVFIEDFV